MCFATRTSRAWIVVLAYLLTFMSCASTSTTRSNSTPKKPSQEGSNNNSSETEPRGTISPENGISDDESSDGVDPTIVWDGPPIIWAVGGWNSCVGTPEHPTPGPHGMNMMKNFGPMYQSLKNKVAPKLEYFASCLRPDIRVARYIHSKNPSDLKTMPRDDLAKHVASIALSQRSPIIIIGHSFGGWISMKAVPRMPGLKIKMLLTMDAISPVTCQFDNAASWIQQKINGTTSSNPPNGCTASPPDINEAQRDFIKTRVDRWVNIWQIDTLKALHADPISQAENVEFKQDFVTALNGHINLGLNKDVWKKIEAYTEETLKK